MEYLVATVSFGENLTAIDTFDMIIDVLVKEFGLSRVIAADTERQVISRIQSEVDDRRHPARQSGNYYLSTNHGSPRKKELLDRIANRLGAQLEVNTFER